MLITRSWRVLGGTRRRLAACAAGLTIAGLGASLLVHPGTASAATWTPSTAQAARAVLVARMEAASTIPGPKGAPVTSAVPRIVPRSAALMVASAGLASSWPSNVTSVEYVASHRQPAEGFVDGTSIADNRSVVVLRMTGRFSVAIIAPKGARPYATGTVMTVIIDASTGQVLDFGLDNTARALPSPVVAFRR
jgi:hypothetical protein